MFYMDAEKVHEEITVLGGFKVCAVFQCRGEFVSGSESVFKKSGRNSFVHQLDRQIFLIRESIQFYQLRHNAHIRLPLSIFQPLAHYRSQRLS